MIDATELFYKADDFFKGFEPKLKKRLVHNDVISSILL
jgi:hypothetical protein